VNDETREAMKRYRDMLAGLCRMAHPRELPYTHLEVSTGAAELCMTAWNADAHRLARAFVAYLDEREATSGDCEQASRIVRTIYFMSPFADTAGVVANALIAARAEERERCARIAEGMLPADYGYAQMSKRDYIEADVITTIAARIRQAEKETT
jgi:hypothetical protein